MPSTEVPTTDVPTTVVTTTEVPTEVPTTVVTTTEVPTDGPTTDVPTTDVPTTDVPTTVVTTSEVPTDMPSTEVPTTDVPTEVPTTVVTTTEVPTDGPTTDGPTTVVPTTDVPTTVVTTTEVPTDMPSTEVPTTEVPTTVVTTPGGPTTDVPTTDVPTTDVPTTDVPTTVVTTTEVPTEVPTTVVTTTEVPTEVPTTVVTTPGGPTTDVPTTDVPTTDVPTTDVPTTVVTTTEVPTDMPSTEVPTTDVPTTVVTTTEVPTEVPTTVVTTTEVPTDGPTTDVPTTDVPTTDVPTTVVTTSEVPTDMPSTEVPTTDVPTEVPTTVVTTTEVPTDGPTTDGPTTVVPTTDVPTTVVTTTEVPTDMPSTEVPTTEVPTTVVTTPGGPTTDVPTTDVPTTDVPTTDVPTTVVTTTEVPTEVPTTVVTTTEVPTEVPTTVVTTPGGPTTDVPTTDVPTTDVPTTDVPTTVVTTSEVPTDMPSTEVPTTDVPTTVVTTTEVPTEVPTTVVTTTEVPTNGPTTDGPTTVVPTTDVPTTVVTTTEVPTDMPSTEVPTTDIPSTDVPTTDVPTTVVTTTEVPTEVPTTVVTTTEVPTEVPTTVVTTTEVPTDGPTTDVPTTDVPTTDVPTTVVTTTEVPTTVVTTTEVPTPDMTTTDMPTTDVTSTTSPPVPTTVVTTTEVPTEVPTTVVTTTEVPTPDMTTTDMLTTDVTSTASPPVPTTVVTTTEVPTEVPTTVVTTTEVPTPDVTTTDVPTPDVTTTDMPTTHVTSTTSPPDVPSTVVTTTEVPTEVPTTVVTTTDVPTPDGTTTDVPTPDMTTTDMPTTDITSTVSPTDVPTTVVTTTEVPTEVPTTVVTTPDVPTTDTDMPTTDVTSTMSPPDMIPPTVTCPISSETFVPAGSSSAQVNWFSQPSAVDNVDCCISVSCQDSVGGVVVSGGTYNVGNNEVTCTAQDSASNVGNCTFTVTVKEAATTESATTGSTTTEAATTEAATPGVTTPDVTTPDVTTPGVTIPDVTTPDLITPGLTTPDVTTPDVTTTPGVPRPGPTTHDVTTTDVTQTMPPDMIPPTVTCPISSETFVPAGSSSAQVNWFSQPSAVDNVDCCISVSCQDSVGGVVVSGGTYNVGNNEVTCTAQDSASNVGNCTFTVTVKATTEAATPGVTTPDVTTPDVTTPGVTIPDVTTPDLITPGLTTPDVTTPDVTTTPGVPRPGPTTHDVTTTDVTQTMPPDNDGPIVTCPMDKTTSGVAGAFVDWSGSPDATDVDITVNAGSVVCRDGLNNVVTSGGFFQAGTTTVTCRANDTALNEGFCVFVIIVDNEAPTVTCPTNKTTNVDSGMAGAIVTWSRSPFAEDVVDATVNADSVVCKDNLDNVTISDGFFQVGKTTVTCRASDISLNEGSCAFVITVTDNEGPTVTCPSAETTNVDASLAGAFVSWSVSPDATDVVDATVNADSVVCKDGPDIVVTSGGFFQAGLTTVTCRAYDNDVNEGSCVFDITVNDNVAPNVTCPMDVTTYLASGMASALVSWSSSPDATDIVDTTVNADSVVCKDGPDIVVTSGGSFQVGTTTVTCRAYDNDLNEGSCVFVITVNDMIPPTVTCPISSETFVPAGSSSAQVNWFSQPSAVDNVDCCISVSCQDSVGGVVVSGGTYNVGNNEVTCTAQDSASNVGNCTFTVTVKDSIPPTVTCPSSSETFVFPGTPSAQVDWSSQPSAVDNIDCCIDVSCQNSLGGVVVSGGTFNVGDHELTCTAQDSVSNEGSCTFTVSVKVLNFVPFGSFYGDRLLSNAVQQRQEALTDLRSEIFYPPNYFPYADDIFEKIYFTEDGVIIFSNEQNLQKRSFPTPGQLVFSDYEDANILAPYWADVDSAVFNIDNNVFYQDLDAAAPGFNKAAELSTISAMVSEHPELSTQYPYFSATWALVITWVNVRPAQAIPTAVDTQYETNTFQVIIATDSTHGFAIMNYHPSHMNWNPAMLFDSNVILGYSYGLLNEHFYVQGVSNIFKPGRDIGNSQLQGRWVFQIDKLPQNYQNPRLFCTNWASRQSFSRWWSFSYFFTAHTCPCSWTMAWFDFRFTYISFEISLPTQGSSGVSLCFVRTFQWPWLAGPRCCYDLFWGSIIVGVRSPLSASVFETYPVSPFFFRVSFYYQQWFDEEFLPRQYCCIQSNLCYIYERFRPPMSCWRYRPPFWSWFWGDPHIMTLDSVGYTFNGLGEFTMLIVDDQPTNGQKMFELQIRTKRALNTETQQLTDATYLSGFAAEIVGGERIEIKANAAADGLITKVNGEVIVPTTEGVMIGNLTVTLEENPMKVAVSYIENIGFAVGINNSFCDITFRIDDEYKTRTKGLMGLWDDDTTNDALRRDGNQQPATGVGGVMTEEDYYQFGITWRITEADSLFYYVDSESFASENDITFTPKFLDNLIAEATTAELDAVMKLCKNDKMCQFDYLSTKDPALGEAAMMINSENQAELNRATNFPPNITLVERIQVTVGERFTLQLEASDMDGDNITFSLAEAIEGASITPEGGLFTWVVVDRTAVKLMFVASDDKSNMTMEPEVELCDCSNGGTCKFGEYVEGTNIMIDRFGVVMCSCLPGWNGDLCEVNYDACEVSPCFHTVACFDMDPPYLNRTCADCPVGLEGDGAKCRDIDECILYENSTASSGGLGCDHNCYNLLQTFNCSCNSGFSLYIDGRRCIDVDECNLQSDNCSPDAVCNNTVGSYECFCNEGYNGDGRVCSDLNECNAENSCDSNSECINTDGSYRCECLTGYEGSGFTCKDMDECLRGLDNCHQEALCGNTMGSFSCSCNDGWTGSGTLCENENECDLLGQPCGLSDSTCTDTVGSFTCTCNEGFLGDGFNCVDKDECTTGEATCFDVLGVCINTPGNYSCKCTNGYSGDGRSSCEDVDECTMGTDDCISNAMCMNTVGGFYCECKPGYYGSGSVCTDVDECMLGVHDCPQDCKNMDGTYTCSCSEGFMEQEDGTCDPTTPCSGSLICMNSTCYTAASSQELCRCDVGFHNPDGGNTCYETNECESDDNPHLCSANANCTNTVGSYNCTCSLGYALNSDQRTCSDVNECLTGDHDCDEMSQVCANAEPFFTCDCKDGYQRSTESGPCDDINECMEDPSPLTCHVHADCINTNGSYTCQCMSGYIGNGMMCFDIDECRLPETDPLIANCHSQAVCTNLAGSFQCNCSMGFEGNGTTCQDIKECESVDPVCTSNSTCSDTEGSYLCMCNSGYRGDGFSSCVNINECQENPDLCHSLATCTDTEGSYECKCDPGYQGSGTVCTNENECTSGNNSCAVGSSQCTDNVGSYICMCNSGYVSAEGLIQGRQCDDVDECEMNLDSCDTVVSTCNNTPGAYDCPCLSGFEMQDTACVDTDECQNSSQCSSKTDAVCFNLPGSHECPCMLNFYEENNMCKPGVSYNTSAIFTVVSSVLVLNEGFDLRRHFVRYRADLKRDIEATFNESDVSASFGDVLIYDITPIPGSDSTVLVTFATNMKDAATPEATIVTSFLDVLDGSNMDQVQLNHKVLRNTFIIGAPQCDSSPCMNSGTCASDNTASDGYSCSCLTGYTGQNCEFKPCATASCQNSGACTNDVTSTTGYICACILGFTGTHCEERAPCDDPANLCGNGGTCNNNLFANLRGYTCICPAGFLGDNCEIECTRVCSNNGQLDNVLCTCTCVSPWKGLTCTDCSLSCMNDGVRNDADCTCGCENIPWSGETCSECDITCLGGQNLDTVTCECSVCPFTCQNNGVLDPVNCGCSCIANWMGQACDDCSINSCSNSGTFIDAMCQCDCDGSWAGTTCTECSLTSTSCENSGTLDTSTCQCGCTGSWTGQHCTECLINCENSGTLTAATCECACDGGWTGTLCKDCALDCQNGGTLDSTTCQCACAQSWSGATCSTCPITAASCMNGAYFDAGNCECVCSQANSGETCAVVNPCLDTSRCTSVGRYCSPDQNGFRCPCQAYDGYIQVGSQCLQRPSLRVVVATLVEFLPAYANPTSAGFKKFIAIMESVILWRLDENSTTLMADSVTGLMVQNGSAVVTATIFYPVGVVPPEAATVYVLALNANLIDDMGNSVPIRQNSVTVQDASIPCTVGYCQNGGTCTRSGIFPMFTYMCSCLDSFTGDQCETDVITTTQPTTQAPTQTPDAEPLSTVAIALITVGGFVLLILISTLFLCMCILMRRRYEEGRPGKDYRARSHYYDHQQNRGFARDDSYSDQLSSDESQNSETQRRMNRLMQVMRQSPYLQRNPNQEFIRPYVVTGMEAQYHHDAMSEERGTGLVARNPLAYRRN
ncbi:uncharacterized protein LOC117303459 isoform X5 [Asterias rubens]|uniref:uncharacterized protein LOC117303459 isoform X5 n=1 Tax=Asterias rubens TaxID=7604 RepID=UPI0014556B53|nr:uncharacterized protein LOC117303459 isoform X5 [Asterias rubens]